MVRLFRIGNALHCRRRLAKKTPTWRGHARQKANPQMQKPLYKLFLIQAAFALTFGAFCGFGVGGIVWGLVIGTAVSGLIQVASSPDAPTPPLPWRQVIAPTKGGACWAWPCCCAVMSYYWAAIYSLFSSAYLVSGMRHRECSHP